MTFRQAIAKVKPSIQIVHNEEHIVLWDVNITALKVQMQDAIPEYTYTIREYMGGQWLEMKLIGVRS